MRRALALSAGLFVSGCVNIPEQSDFQFDVSGNYKAVADCSFLAIRGKYIEHTKVELESLKTSEIVWGTSSASIGKLDFIDAGPGRTTVKSYMPRAIYGPDFYEKRYRPIIEACAGKGL